MTAGKSQDQALTLEELLQPFAGEELTDKEQLRRLKMSLGTRALCPSLITPASWWRNELHLGLYKLALVRF